MTTCKHCGSTNLVKAGFNPSGSQRYSCKACQRTSTLAPSRNGHDPHVRVHALRLYVDGTGLRAIARQLGISPQSVANWVKAYVAHLTQPAPKPANPDLIELDELFTFVGHKKTKSMLLRQLIAIRAASQAGH